MPHIEYLPPEVIDNSKGWRNSPLNKYITKQYAKENDYSDYNKLIEELKSELICLPTSYEVTIKLDDFLKELHEKTPSIRHDEYIPTLMTRIKLAEMGFDSLY